MTDRYIFWARSAEDRIVNCIWEARRDPLRDLHLSKRQNKRIKSNIAGKHSKRFANKLNGEVAY